ncbi:MAG: GTPase [Bacilli bacterium]
MNDKKCTGCGSILQTLNKDKDGYVSEKVISSALLCERCFKIKNYGVYSVADTRIDYEKIIYDIDKTSADVVFLIDILNLNKETIKFLEYFKKRVYVILTKRDLIPKSVSDKKLIKYFKENYYDTDFVMCVSSISRKNIDEFYNKINKDKVRKLYVVGLTNSGKSTFINALMGSVGLLPNITVSSIPNTTLDYINIKLNDKLTIIDTPGFIMENSIYKFLSLKSVVDITPKKEIKVHLYQLKEGWSILVEDIIRIDYIKGVQNSFCFYMNNDLKYEKIKTKTNDKLKVLPKLNIELDGKKDIVINGVGFIKIVKPANVVVYTLDEKLVSVRSSMI